MSKPRQTTLFQSWNGPRQCSQQSGGMGVASTSTSSQLGMDQFGDEDEDADLLQAMELSLREAEMSASRDGWGESTTRPHSNGAWQGATTTLFSSVGSAAAFSGKEPAPHKFTLNPPTTKSNALPQVKTRNPLNMGLFKKNEPKQSTLTKYSSHQNACPEEEDENPAELTEEELMQLEDIPGFDKGAGQVWIYPTNYPVRDYQLNIAKVALFTNTLVVLPTGLGKTFVAAVIMYNFYRWYPQGKVIFMAPTKPLVAQQIEACYNVMGIPQSDAAEMTGTMQPADRREAWKARRMFFLTPQVLTNDLTREALPALSVKCLVIDEAHKALGNHAYCQVVRELAKYEGQFRVLALSATPGSDMKAVQQVITNLMVSHVELRGEESPEIRPYTHERHVEKVVVQLGAELTAVKEKYLRVMTLVVNRLKRLDVIFNREVKSLSKFLLLKSREAFRQNPPHNLPQHQFGSVEGDFALAISLYHGFDLLQQHGLRSLQSYLLGIISGDKGYGRTRAELLRNQDFTDMMEMIKRFTPVKNAVLATQQTQSASQLAKPFEVGHPKMAKLQEIALAHFTNFEGDDNGASTRIMVFAQYRDSVNEITEMLNRHRPLIKAMSFIGQSSAGKAAKGFTQKEQLKVMQKFREGGYNTLVATCVGEEGLDIGDVDLIICFDAHGSPIRLVQRMGRTGRKRAGKIIMLVSAGKEEQIYNQSQYKKRSIHKAIENGAKSLVFYPGANRMVPAGLNPRCHRMQITVHQRYQPRTKAGRTTGKTNTTIVNGKAKKAKVVEDGFLSPEELAYWSKHFKVPDKEIHKLPASHFVSLKGAARPTAPVGPTLSLSDWMPWQNRLQTTLLADHSMQARHLVDIVDFMQVQTAIGDGEDTYGQEMHMFLDKEDVIIKTNKPRGMLRYCTTTEGISTAGRETTSNSVNEATTSGTGQPNRIRRSEQLPTFSSDEDSTGNKSDEDLPDFEGMMCKSPSKKTSPVAENPTATGSNLDSAFDHLVSYKGKGKGKQSRGCTGGAKDLDDALKNSYKANGNKLDTSPPNNVIQKARQKKRHPAECMNQLVVPMIEDSPDEDFEDPHQGTGVKPAPHNTSPPVRDQQKSLNVAVSHWKEDEGTEGIVGDIDQQKSPSNVIMISESDEEGTAMDEGQKESSINAKSALGMSTNQVLPIATLQKEVIAGCLRTDAEHQVPISDDAGLYPVAIPPNVDELPSLLSHLDGRECLSPVDDILALVEKWERHNVPITFPPNGVVRPGEVYSHVKATSALKPVGIPAPSVNMSVYDTPISDTKTSVVQERNDDAGDLAVDLFSDVSMVMEEPCISHVNNKGDAYINPCLEGNQQAGAPDSEQELASLINHVQNTSPTVEKLVVPVTPFIPKKLGRFHFGNNTSTPVTNCKVNKIRSPSCVEMLNQPDVSSAFGDEPLSGRVTKRRSHPGTPQNVSTPNLPTRHSASSIHDSFFSDLHDDFVLAGMEMPIVANETLPVAKEPLPIAMETLPVAKEMITIAKKPVLNAKKTSPIAVELSPDLVNVRLPYPSRLSRVPVVRTTMDNTQLTFSQAFDCVNDSALNTSSNSSSTGTPSPHPPDKRKECGSKKQNLDIPGRISDPSMKGETSATPCRRVLTMRHDTLPSQGSYANRPYSIIQDNKSGSTLPSPTRVALSTMPSSPRHIEIKPTGAGDVSIEEPQFDLGFDFDEDFEDDMIIPPTPEVAAGSQGFLPSQHQPLMVEGATISIPSPQLVASVLQQEQVKTAKTVDNSRCESSENDSPLILWPSAAKHGAGSLHAVGSPDQPKHEALNGMQVNLTDSLAAMFAEGDSEELFCDEEEDTCQPEPMMLPDTFPPFNDITCASNIPCPESSSTVVSLPKLSFKTPDRPAPKTSRSTTSKLQFPVSDSDFVDESPILPPQKRRWRLAILEDDPEVISDCPATLRHKPKNTVPLDEENSPVAFHPKCRLAMLKDDTADDSPVVPWLKRKKAVVFTSEEDDSLVVPVRARRQTGAVVDLTAEDDDDQDFVSTTRMKRPIKERPRNGDVRQEKRARIHKKELVHGAVEFLDLEAERSEDDCSEDESSGEDAYDMSFIHDGTQMSQSQHDPVDMHAIYRQSVRSPLRSSGGFRLSRPRDDIMDVFSQMPQQDADYEEDSFVVQGGYDEEDEEEEHIGDGDHGEVTLAELGHNITMSRQTRRQARIAALRRTAVPRQARPKAVRRVVRTIDSSSEEEAVRLPTPINRGNVRKNKIVSTSSSSSSASGSPKRLCTTSEDEAEDVTKRRPGQSLGEGKHHPAVSRDTSTSPTSIDKQPSLHTRCIRNIKDRGCHSAKTLLKMIQASETQDAGQCPTLSTDASTSQKSISENPRLRTHGVGKIKSGQDNDNRGALINTTPLISNSLRVPSVTNMEPDGDDPTFSLGVDFLDLDDNWEDDDDDGVAIKYPCAATSHRDSPPVPPPPLLFNQPKPVDKLLGPIPSVSNIVMNTTQPVASDRDRRIRLSQQKQEEFRQKLRAQSGGLEKVVGVVPRAGGMGRGGGYHGSQIHTPIQSPLVAAARHCQMTPTPTLARSQSVTVLVTPPKKPAAGKMVVLVDSKEINRATAVMSALRFKHNMQVVVRQVASCDYTVSNRMGVDRISHSVFVNGARRAQLEERVRSMCVLYDRPCIIVEKEPVKGQEQKVPARQQQNTKYTDGVMAAFGQTHIKLLFTDSQEQTAQLMSELAVQEHRKGQAISTPTELTTPQEQVLRFYLTLPGISYVGALNLLHGFRCVADLVQSTHAQLIARGRISDARATDLRAHLNRKFNLQLLSLRS